MTGFDHRPAGSDPPPGFDPWCVTLRGDQTWRLTVPGGLEALTMWRALRDRHPRTGLWPVLLGPDPAVVDQLTWRLDMLARDAPGIPAPETLTPAPELFVEWMGDPGKDDYLHDVPRHLAKLEEDADAIRSRITQRPDEDAVQALSGDLIHLALVPAEAGWQVPALLAWAGAERGERDGAAHLSVLEFWHEQYGADLVSVGLERLELLVARPPEDARSAFGLAVQQYAYCPALMDNLVPAVGALAATLLGRYWLFDWS